MCLSTLMILYACTWRNAKKFHLKECLPSIECANVVSMMWLARTMSQNARAFSFEREQKKYRLVIRGVGCFVYRWVNLSCMTTMNVCGIAPGSHMRTTWSECYAVSFKCFAFDRLHMAILIPLYANVSHSIVGIVVVTKSVPLHVLCACVWYIWYRMASFFPCVPFSSSGQATASQSCWWRIGWLFKLKHIRRFRCPVQFKWPMAYSSHIRVRILKVRQSRE